MILFIGHVGSEFRRAARRSRSRLPRMFGPMAKWVAQIDDAARIPEYVARAFHAATSGRPGPVVLALPEDMLRRGRVADAPPYAARRARHPGAARHGGSAAAAGGAKRPLVILGGGGWTRAGLRRHAALRRGQRLPAGRRVPLPGPARQPQRPPTWATSASASTRSSPSA